MAPDFAYFVSLGVGGNFTHTAWGVPVYCVPAGLIVYLVYCLLVRPALLAWLPHAVSARMPTDIQWTLRSPGAMATVLISLAVGALTHIIWDSFTHANTVVVDSLSWLRTVVALGEYQIPVFKLLQHLSSLAGLVVIVSSVAMWFKRTAPGLRHPAPLSVRQRMFTLSLVVAAGVFGGVAGSVYRSAKTIEHGLFHFVVTGMASAAFAVLVLCIAWRVNARRG
jgi:hypothetical protein